MCFKFKGILMELSIAISKKSQCVLAEVEGKFIQGMTATVDWLLHTVLISVMQVSVGGLSQNLENDSSVNVTLMFTIVLNFS